MQVKDSSGRVQGERRVSVSVDNGDDYVDPTYPSRTSAAAVGHGRTVAFVVDRGGVEVEVKCHDSQPSRVHHQEVMRVLREDGTYYCLVPRQSSSAETAEGASFSAHPPTLSSTHPRLVPSRGKDHVLTAQFGHRAVLHCQVSSIIFPVLKIS